MTPTSQEPTDLPEASMPVSSMNKVVAAAFAAKSQSIDTSPLTTTTRQEQSVDSSAISATAPSESSNSMSRQRRTRGIIWPSSRTRSLCLHCGKDPNKNDYQNMTTSLSSEIMEVPTPRAESTHERLLWGIHFPF